MKFDSIQSGETYYTVTKGRAGNTTLSTVHVHSVRVISTDTVKQTVTASWNSNPARVYYQGQYGSWRKNKPLLIGGAMGLTKRLATRDEIAAHKAAIKAQEGTK